MADAIRYLIRNLRMKLSQKANLKIWAKKIAEAAKTHEDAVKARKQEKISAATSGSGCGRILVIRIGRNRLRSTECDAPGSCSDRRCRVRRVDGHQLHMGFADRCASFCCAA